MIHLLEPQSLKAALKIYSAKLRRTLLTVGLVAIPFTARAAEPAAGSTPPLAAATHALLDGNADSAVAQLNSILAANPDELTSANAHLLLCRAFYAQSMAAAASTLIEINREPRLAERALRDYLASAAKSDAAPAFKVHVTLAKLLRNQGNTAAAKIELEQSLSLASSYAPARRELAALEHQTGNTIAALR
jgi:hypothetical protein